MDKALKKRPHNLVKSPRKYFNNVDFLLLPMFFVQQYRLCLLLGLLNFAISSTYHSLLAHSKS